MLIRAVWLLAAAGRGAVEDLKLALQHGHVDPEVVEALQRSHIVTKEALLVST